MFAGGIEAYSTGLATSAEDADAWTGARLWLGRKTLLAGSAAMMLLVSSDFTAKVLAEARKATRALTWLQATAPTCAAGAEDTLRAESFEEALKSIILQWT